MTDLHEFLRIHSGMSVDELHDKVLLYRRNKMWQAIPATRETFDAGLEQLARDGLATKSEGGVWHWIPERRQPVVEPKGERLLFV